MKSYIIEGGKKLDGVVKIEGSKNASLPILAACILNADINKLYNIELILQVLFLYKLTNNFLIMNPISILFCLLLLLKIKY